MPQRQLLWFAILAQPQREYVAALLLKSMFSAETYVPTETRWRRKNRYCKSKVQVAFAVAPGYVLAGFSSDPPWFTILDMPGIRGVINDRGNPIILDEHTAILDDAGRPVRLTDAMLRRYMGTVPNGIYDPASKSVTTTASSPDAERYMRTHREFAAGDEVDVVLGPMRDHRVKVLSVEGKKATIEIELFGQVKEVDIPIWHLERAA